MAKSAEEIAADAAASAEGATEKPNTKPEDVETIKKENARLIGTVQGLQKVKDDFENYKKEQERSKLSDSDRVKAELEDARKGRLEVETKNAALEKQLQNQKLVNELVADYGLSNPEFGDVIVGKYDASKETFKEFATRVSTDPKYTPVFVRASGIQEKSVPSRGAAPPGPATGGSRGKQVVDESQEASDKAWANRRYPNDPEKQKSLLSQLNKQRAGKE